MKKNPTALLSDQENASFKREKVIKLHSFIIKCLKNKNFIDFVLLISVHVLKTLFIILLKLCIIKRIRDFFLITQIISLK